MTFLHSLAQYSGWQLVLQVMVSEALPEHCSTAGAACLTAVVRLLQLLISKWDQRLSRNILAHWLDLMNSQGWIAREQASVLRMAAVIQLVTLPRLHGT